MKYARYKRFYADCDVLNDYDKNSKTITVIVPEERVKKSGVRGRHYIYYRFKGVENATARRQKLLLKLFVLKMPRSSLRNIIQIVLLKYNYYKGVKFYV